ncbi:Ribonuclease P protein subunit p25 [Lamellibrachia satsuma]|nr:Ribonuclease P protein subunit p25 [Lamellibrachia satsuma]
MSDDVIHMRVQDGSKIRNLMSYAFKKIKEPGIHQISWNGSGSAIPKTITCAEVMKRKIKGLHQITDIRYKRVEEFWEPKLEGLERLKVKKNVPSMTILLSKDALDTGHPSYQAPGSFETLWQKNADDEQKAAVSRWKNKSGANLGSMERKRRRKGGKDPRNNNNKSSGNTQTDSVGGGKVSGRDSAQGGNNNGGATTAGKQKQRKNMKTKKPKNQSDNQKADMTH